jgi:hypothetical protein
MIRRVCELVVMLGECTLADLTASWKIEVPCLEAHRDVAFVRGARLA